MFHSTSRSTEVVIDLLTVRCSIDHTRLQRNNRSEFKTRNVGGHSMTLVSICGPGNQWSLYAPWCLRGSGSTAVTLVIPRSWMSVCGPWCHSVVLSYQWSLCGPATSVVALWSSVVTLSSINLIGKMI
ncbi:hypothetical protein BgiMline_005879 [Biomphalaria glabrata]|nr:hypothetical protein BgiMline_003876 [Biomphalaria glabrata]